MSLGPASEIRRQKRARESRRCWRGTDAPPDEKQAATVFRWLKPDEQAVARAWAVSGAASWEEAAQSAGLPDAFGDRVRRKLKRLGERYEQRRASAAVSGLWLPGQAGPNPAGPQ
ncbi:hypothetical protein ACFCX0_45760 [Streptomyces sp. NPDC056352]|uniref:hypothetical protein n=1 Tax=Streptomyces sp. NPDC056352 TaxID=3345791 RepID=UPI0035D54853